MQGENRQNQEQPQHTQAENRGKAHASAALGWTQAVGEGRTHEEMGKLAGVDEGGYITSSNCVRTVDAIGTGINTRLITIIDNSKRKNFVLVIFVPSS
jgi:hypothetical protein